MDALALPVAPTGAATGPSSPLIPLFREAWISPASVFIPSWREVTVTHGALCGTRPQAGPAWKGGHVEFQNVLSCAFSTPARRVSQGRFSGNGKV